MALFINKESNSNYSKALMDYVDNYSGLCPYHQHTHHHFVQLTQSLFFPLRLINSQLKLKKSEKLKNEKETEGNYENNEGLI